MDEQELAKLVITNEGIFLVFEYASDLEDYITLFNPIYKCVVCYDGYNNALQLK